MTDALQTSEKLWETGGSDIMADGKFRDIREGMWGAAVIAFSLLTPFLRSWRAKWGATGVELQKKFPGDELVSNPKWQYTNAITIAAPIEKVWPWMVQIGQGRGGFYSYQSLENLVGCDIHNADGIIPEFQILDIDDGIKLHPEMPGYPVKIIEPGRFFVLHADTRTGTSPIPDTSKPGGYFASTWGFFLETTEDTKTRMISRFRSDYSPGIKNSLYCGPCLVEPVSTAMQRKMLQGIKQRAEAVV